MQIVKMVQAAKELPYMLKVSETEALIIAKAVYRFPYDQLGDEEHREILNDMCDLFRAWGILE